MDKYRRGLPEHRWDGTIVSRAGSRCWIRWDSTPDEISEYPEGDVRYWVDSGRARIQQPTQETLVTKMLRNNSGS